ncbi:hypothetical protein C499_05960 [Halogeometricum borinquense DSM 11551]|uniref:Uncharacterized protein n=2 Tax=Halogeometricum borinquense TaxID=60847 RepID=E4NVC9_HALBP|nr:hypothetical protein [Halogeometricum borinquense]ADQ69118.1 hypothetical protein Hbor_36000 [Halogeometricum borinquense DSM 11551]ELY29379.1 hypothetical protein C499_05960 [Halogeometricum borinquense DSM 11551]RYJ08272.1 hypothetical protein ELS19_17090 [Halogeometricum borinquense]
MSERAQDVSDEDGYVEKLRDKIGSGGGCAEAWQAAQEIRDSGSVNVGRRKLLTGIGASLLFGVSATDAVAATSGETSEDLETEVTELDGAKKKEVIKTAQADSSVQSARNKLQSRGWTANVDEATAHQSVHEGEKNLTVRIPYQNSDASPSGVQEDAGIIWSTWSSGLTHGFISRREVRKGASLSKDAKEAYEQSDIDLQSTDTVPVEISYTIFNEDQSDSSDSATVQSTKGTENTGEDSSNSLIVPVQKSSSRSDSVNSGASVQSAGEATTQGIADCACTATLGTNPVTACAPCGTVKPDCLVQIISNYGSEIGACAGCATVAALTSGAGAIAGGCLPCLGTIGETVASGKINSVCCWCNFGGDII